MAAFRPNLLSIMEHELFIRWLSLMPAQRTEHFQKTFEIVIQSLFCPEIILQLSLIIVSKYKVLGHEEACQLKPNIIPKPPSKSFIVKYYSHQVKHSRQWVV